jgi:hypothetical protein
MMRQPSAEKECKRDRKTHHESGNIDIFHD